MDKSQTSQTNLSPPTDRIVVLGAGGHAKVVISTIVAAGGAIAGIYDDDEGKRGRSILGHTVNASPSECRGDAVIAIGDNAQRERVARAMTYQWRTVVHPSAHVDPSAILGAGVVIFAGAIIQPDVVLGDHVIVNSGATIDHDCSVGDFAHIAPGVHLAGGVQVGRGAFFGIGSVVLPGLKIGAWATVGAGAVVIRDLPERAVAYGVPAKQKNL